MQTATKKSLLVVITLGIIAIMVGAGTLAYFSSTSTVEGNLFTAGTIVMSTSGDEIPLEASLTDLKPCMKGEGTITVTNDGTNPFDLWLKIENVVTGPGTTPSSELGEDPADDINDIDGVIRFDLSFDGSAVIDDGCDYTISDGTHQLVGLTTGVKDKYIKVGNILPGDSVDVSLSFTMDGDTTNWAQGDTMKFDVTFYALQSEGSPPAPTPQLVIPVTCPTGITDLCNEQPGEGICDGPTGCEIFGESTCVSGCDWDDGSAGACTGTSLMCPVLSQADCGTDIACTWNAGTAGSCSGVSNIAGCAAQTDGTGCTGTTDYTQYCYDPYTPIDPLCAGYTTGATCVANPNCAWMPTTSCTWTPPVSGTCTGPTGCSMLGQTDCNKDESTICAWTPQVDPFCDGPGCDGRTQSECDLDCTWLPPA